MKSIETCGIDLDLVRNVFDQLGYENDHDNEELASELSDIYNHGADTGWSGFIYTSDTVGFYLANRTAINALIYSMADDMGEPAAEMVAGFNCLGKRDAKAIREYLPSVYRCIGGGPLTDDDDNVANALAWFALEEVARALID